MMYVKRERDLHRLPRQSRGKEADGSDVQGGAE